MIITIRFHFVWFPNIGTDVGSEISYFHNTTFNLNFTYHIFVKLFNIILKKFQPLLDCTNQMNINEKQRSKIQDLKIQIESSNDRANQAKIESLNLRARLRRMDELLRNLKEAKEIDRKVLNDRLTYTADTVNPKLYARKTKM